MNIIKLIGYVFLAFSHLKCLDALLISPSTTAEEIVIAQLNALQKSDMEGVYEFASPNNKQQTGNLERFSQMVRADPYRYLLGHERAQILLSSKIAKSEQYLVRIIATENFERGSKTIKEYWWSLSRCRAGPMLDCFMVDAVIPNS